MTSAAGPSLSPSPGPGRPPLLHRLSGPWHSRDFRWYWAATSAQAVSQGMQFLVLGWMVLEVTGSATQLGLTLFAYGLPNTALLVLGGAIADRMNRKWLLMLTQAAVAGFILALAAVTLAGLLQLWHIYLLAVGLGVLQGLNQPARVALISDVADQRSLLDAVAQSNAAVHLGRIVGPPAAGVLIDYGGLGAAAGLRRRAGRLAAGAERGGAAVPAGKPLVRPGPQIGPPTGRRAAAGLMGFLTQRRKDARAQRFLMGFLTQRRRGAEVRRDFCFLRHSRESGNPLRRRYKFPAGLRVGGCGTLYEVAGRGWASGPPIRSL